MVASRTRLGFRGCPLIWGVIQTVLNAMKLFS